MLTPTPIHFVYHPWGENTFFYELDVVFGERVETVGGSEAFIGPQIELMRAAVTLLAGRQTAEAHFPAENDTFVMTLALPPHSGDPHWREALLERPVQMVWSEIGHDGQMIETRTLGWAESLLNFAEAALALGEARQAVWPHIRPCAAMIILRAALEPLKAAQPTR